MTTMQRQAVNWRRAAAVAAGPLLLSVFCLAQAPHQSLADVVRQTKPAHKAARVITNDDIPSVTPAAEPTATVTGSEASDDKETTGTNTAAGATPASTDKPGASSKSGISVPGLLNRGSLAQAQALLESLKHDHQALIDNYDKIEKKLAETDDESLRQVYSDSLARRNETMSRNEKAIADTESAIHAAQAADAQGDTNETQ